MSTTGGIAKISVHPFIRPVQAFSSISQ